jgi:hypothetical protein
MIKLTLNSSLQKRRTDEEGEEEAAFRFPRNKVPRGRKSTMRLGRNFQAVSSGQELAVKIESCYPLKEKLLTTALPNSSLPPSTIAILIDFSISWPRKSSRNPVPNFHRI